MSDSSKSTLSAELIRRALERVSSELGAQGVTGEVCLFGGTVMVLAFAARPSTKDVDAIFKPAPLIREIADRVGSELGLETGWLNDGVKGFIATEPPITTKGLPQFPHLRVTRPTAEYLLAMKCMAGRMGAEGASDLPDIRFLIRHLALKTAQQTLDLVAQYYGRSGVPAKTQYLVEGLFEEGGL
jgi:hypothetical protein